MTNLHKHLPYYVPGIVLFAIGLIVLFVWDATLSNFLLGILLAGAGLSLGLLGYWKGQANEERKLPANNGSTNVSQTSSPAFNNGNHRSIHMQSGTYNESVQGDCITIQGNRIYINQGLSEFTAQIQEVLLQLRNDGYSREAAEQGVVNDLKKYTNSNIDFKEKLLHWKATVNSSNGTSFRTTETVKRVLKLALESTSYVADEPLPGLEDRYAKLDSLLRNGSWEEADEETFRIVAESMPKPIPTQTYRGFTYYFIDADQVTPGVLIKLNQLWVRYSNGRFGFSVQQDVWKEILTNYDHDESWVDEDAYSAFIDAVGWTRSNDRVYHVDINYSLWAERGHLPANLMLGHRNYFAPSNYCYLNIEVFDTIMKCKYFSNPHIPSWLQQWLDDIG